jgi:hypothetical protein
MAFGPSKGTIENRTASGFAHGLVTKGDVASARICVEEGATASGEFDTTSPEVATASAMKQGKS